MWDGGCGAKPLLAFFFLGSVLLLLLRLVAVFLALL